MAIYFDTGEKKLCSGCRCCEFICPVSAIRMNLDEEGFLYPYIDQKLCIKCNLCRKTCPFVKEEIIDLSKKGSRVYAVKNKNKQVVKDSSSGGVFSLLAEYVLAQNGFVVGCAFDENLYPNHVMIHDSNELSNLRGSKYVQSDLGDIYSKVKSVLEQGSMVLFTGTPCQIDGINAFLKNEYDNLVTADFVCHGVPSNMLFHQYLRYLEKKKSGEIISYRFRDKEKYGWSSDGSYILKKKYKTFRKNVFPESDYYVFCYGVKNCVQRESCYVCKYASAVRKSDFTMADFWGIEKIHPEFYSKEGVSMLMLNTEKSEMIFHEMKQEIEYLESDAKIVKSIFPHLQHPTVRPNLRETFYSQIREDGFDSTVKKHCKLQYIRAIIRRWIPERLKQKLRFIIGRFK